jgi:hypothetical protein
MESKDGLFPKRMLYVTGRLALPWQDFFLNHDLPSINIVLQGGTAEFQGNVTKLSILKQQKFALVDTNFLKCLNGFNKANKYLLHAEISNHVWMFIRLSQKVYLTISNTEAGRKDPFDCDITVIKSTSGTNKYSVLCHCNVM